MQAGGTVSSLYGRVMVSHALTGRITYCQTKRRCQEATSHGIETEDPRSKPMTELGHLPKTNDLQVIPELDSYMFPRHSNVAKLHP